MGFADVEYETREEAQLALEGWNGGQLDGEIVEVLFAKKVAKPIQSARPVRSRAPLSPPRRSGGRVRSPPRRRNEGTVLTLGSSWIVQLLCTLERDSKKNNFSR